MSWKGSSWEPGWQGWPQETWAAWGGPWNTQRPPGIFKGFPAQAHAPLAFQRSEGSRPQLPEPPQHLLHLEHLQHLQNLQLQDASQVQLQEEAEPGLASIRLRSSAKLVRRRPRLWAHIFLYKRHDDFDLVPMLIGKNGHNMRNINLATNAKLRIRGRGSGHLEVDTQKEAPVPLMLAITAEDTNEDNFLKATEMAITKLNELAKLYKNFCRQRNLPAPTVKEQLFCIGEISRSAETLLKDLVELYAHPGGPRVSRGKAPVGELQLEEEEEFNNEPDDGEGRRPRPRGRGSRGKASGRQNEGADQEFDGHCPSDLAQQPSWPIGSAWQQPKIGWLESASSGWTDAKEVPARRPTLLLATSVPPTLNSAKDLIWGAAGLPQPFTGLGGSLWERKDTGRGQTTDTDPPSKADDDEDLGHFMKAAIHEFLRGENEVKDECN